MFLSAPFSPCAGKFRRNRSRIRRLIARQISHKSATGCPVNGIVCMYPGGPNSGVKTGTLN